MSITFEAVTKRRDGDVSALYLEAQAEGLEVSHYPSWKCATFNARPEGSVLGMFRTIGHLIFYKDERRWEVRARADATAVDLATLIKCGLDTITEHGRQPGHWTRRKFFTHTVSKRTEKRIASAPICYQLSAEDLLGAATVAAVQVGDDVGELLAAPGGMISL